MGAQGSNELNALLKAKVVKIKVELDYKGSNLGQQVKDITKYLKDHRIKLKVELQTEGLKSQVDSLNRFLKTNDKKLKIDVEIATTANKLNGQLRSVVNKLKKEKSLEPLKIDVNIDVKGSAKAIKRQLREVNDTIQDFNKKYGKQLADMQKKADRASQSAQKGAQSIKTPNTAMVGGFDYKAYANQLNDAKKYMKSSFGKGFFSSTEMKDAEGNLHGFIASLTKANGVVQKIQYQWSKDASTFLPINQTTVTNSEKAVASTVNSLKELDREIVKLGKNQDKFWKESNELQKKAHNGDVHKDAIDNLKRRIKDEQALEQAVKKENDALLEQKSLIREINRAKDKDWNKNQNIDSRNQYKALAKNVETNPDLKNQALELQKINDLNNERNRIDKEYMQNTKQRLKVQREIRSLESKTVSNDRTSQSLLAEVKLMTQRAKTGKEWLEVSKHIAKIQTSNNNDSKIEKSVDLQFKIRQKMEKLVELGKMTSKQFDDAMAQLPITAQRNFADLERQYAHLNRKVQDENERMKKSANQTRVIFDNLTPDGKAKTEAFKKVVDSGDIAEIQKYIGTMKKGEVETVKLAETTDKLGRAVTELQVKMKGHGKTVQTYTLQMERANGTLRQTQQGMDYNANRNLGIMEQLKIAMARVPVWMTAMTAFYGTINGVRAMVQEILTLDKALTELKRVASDSINIDTIFEGSIDLSKSLGNNIHNIMDTMAEFARTFGNFNERQLLAITNTATLMSNVSDLTTTEAGDSLVGTMNAFNLEASESIRIVDALNEVDNNYAISTKQLATGLAKSASTARTFGVEMEENIGHITAIGAVTMESGNIIGNSLKTIYSRITTLTKSQETLEGIGIAMTEIGKNGEEDVRPVADILDDLSVRWFDLSKAQQQNTAVQVAGRYQLSRFLALMNNYEMAMEATDTAVHSQGSAMRENAQYMKSFEARINQLKNGFTELSSAVGDAVLSGGMLAVINSLTTLAGVATKAVQAVGALPIALAGVFAIANKLGFLNKFKDSLGFIGLFGKAYKENVATTPQLTRMQALQSSWRSLTVAEAGATAGAVGWGVAIKGALISTGIGAVIVALGFAIEKLVSKYQDAKQKQEEMVSLNKKMVDGYRQHEDGMQGLIKRYDELGNKTNLSLKEQREYNNIQKELATSIPTTVSYIDANGKAHMKSTDAIKREIEVVKQLSLEQARLTDVKFQKTMDKRSEAFIKVTENIKKLNDEQKKLEERGGSVMNFKGQTIDSGEAIQKNKVEIMMAEAEKTDAIQKTIKAVQDQALAHFEAQGKLAGLGEEQQAVIEKFIGYNEAMLRYADTPKEFEKAYQDLFNIGAQVGEVFSEAFNKMSKGMEDDPIAINQLKKDLGELSKAIPKTFFELTDEMGKPKKSIDEVTAGLKEIINVGNRVAKKDSNWDGLIGKLEKAGLSTKEAEGYLKGLAREHDNAKLRAEAQARGVEDATASIEDLSQATMEAIDLTSTLFGYSGSELEGIKSHITAMHLLTDTMGEAGKKTEEYQASQEAVTDFLGITASELEANADKYYGIVDALGKLDFSKYTPSMSWETFINKSDLDKEMKGVLLSWDGTKNIITGANAEIVDSNEEVKESTKDMTKDIFSEKEVNEAVKRIDKTTEKVSGFRKAIEWMEAGRAKEYNIAQNILAKVGIDLDLNGLAKNLDDMDDKVINAVTKIKEKIGKINIKGSIGNFLEGLPEATSKKLGEWNDSINNFFTGDGDGKTFALGMGKWLDSIIDWFQVLPEKTTEKLDSWWTTISTWIDGVPEKIKEKLIGWGNAFTGWIDEQNELNKVAYGGWWNTLSTWFDEQVTNIKEKLDSWKQAINDWIGSQAIAWTDGLVTWMTAIGKWFDDLPENTREKLGNWWTSIGNWFLETQDNWTTSLDIWKTVIGKWFDDLPENTRESFNNWWTSITTWIGDKTESWGTNLGNWTESIVKWSKGLGNKTLEGFETWWTDITNWIKDTAKNWDENLDTWWKAMGEWFNGLKDKEEPKKGGKDIVASITKGIDDNKKDILEKISEIILDIPKYVLIAGGVMLLGLGREIIQRIIKGIEEDIPNWDKKWDKLKKKAIEKLFELGEDGYKEGKKIIGKIADGIASKYKDFTDKFVEMKDRALKKMKEMREDLVKFAKSIPGKIGEAIGNFAGGVESGVKKLANTIAGKIEGGLNGTVVKGMNSVLDFMGSKHKVPKVNLPRYAVGTKSRGHQGGHAIVGEKGRELAYIPNVGYKVLGKQGSEIVDLPKGTSVLPNKETEVLLKKHGFPAYEDGVGDWFMNFMDKPKELMGKVWSALPQISMPSGAFGEMATSGIGKVKDEAISYIGKKMKDWFSFDGIGSMGQMGAIGAGAEAWKSAIIAVARQMRENVSPSEVMGIIAQINKESGGRQTVTQSSSVWDINTANGNPARGLLQYIPSTFNAYKMKGHNNIYSGIDQLFAFFNNSSWRRDLPYGRRGWSPRGGRRFANGGFINERIDNATIGEEGEEVIIPLIKKRKKRGIDLWKEAGYKLGVFQDPRGGGQEYSGGGSFGAMSGDGGGEGGGGDSGTSGTLINSAPTISPAIFSGAYNLDGEYEVSALATKKKPATKAKAKPKVNPREGISPAFTYDKYERETQAIEAYISRLEITMNGLNKGSIKYRDTLKSIIAQQNKHLAVQKKDLSVTEKRQSAIKKELAKLPSLSKQSTKQREQYNKLMEEYDSNLGKIQGLKNEIASEAQEIKNKSIELFTDLIDQIVTSYDKAIDVIKGKIDDTDFKLDVLALTNPDDKRQLLNAQQEKATQAQAQQATGQNKVNDLQKKYDKAKVKGKNTPEELKAKEELDNAKEELEDYILATLQAEKDIKDTRASIADDAIDRLKDYYTSQKDMALDAIDLEIKALQKAHDKKMKMYDEETEKINSVYDDKIKSMDKEQEAENFNEGLKEKNDAKTVLVNKIALLSRDTSKEGRKKLAELQKELIEVNKDIDAYNKERKDKLVRDGLAEQKDEQLKAIDAEKEKAEKILEFGEDMKDDGKGGTSALEKQKEDINKTYEDLMNNDKKWADMRNQAIKGNFETINKELEKMNQNLNKMASGDFSGLFKDYNKVISKGVKKEVKANNKNEVDNLIYNSTDANSDVDEARRAKPYQMTDADGKKVKGGTKVDDPKVTTPAPAKKPPAKKPTPTKKPPAKKPSKTPAKKPSTSSKEDRKIKSAVSFRSKPAYGNNIISNLPKGTKVDYVGMEKGWAKIKYKGKTGYVGSSFLQKFDTGGYTGNWAGKEGKVAMLHKKELVLNERQTSDILDSSKIIEKVASVIPALKRSSLTEKIATASGIVNISYGDINVTVENGDKKKGKDIATEIMKGMKKKGR